VKRPLKASTHTRTAVAICFATACAISAPATVHAQGLFDLLLGALRGSAPRAYNREEPPRLLENFPKPGEQLEERSSAPAGGPHVAYCVRTCDGRYFPLPASSRGGRDATPASLCSAMCPSAQTKIYSGSAIERAVASDGKRYTDLKNAFLYREKVATDCTCNGRDTNGVARVDPKQDPTLRPGDIIVTAEGPLVFKGSRGSTRQASDFVTPDDYRSLPKGVRATLADMRIAPEVPIATAKSEPVQADRQVVTKIPGGDARPVQGAQAPQQISR